MCRIQENTELMQAPSRENLREWSFEFSPQEYLRNLTYAATTGDLSQFIEWFEEDAEIFHRITHSLPYAEFLTCGDIEIYVFWIEEDLARNVWKTTLKDLDLALEEMQFG